MGVSADLIYLKEGTVDDYREAVINENPYEKYSVVMYIGSSDVTTENTFDCYDIDKGIFTLGDAFEKNLISDAAIKRIADYFSTIKIPFEYAITDTSYIVDLNY